MKVKDGFILRTVAGETIVLPTGGTVDMDLMITLNDTGRFLWQAMEQETTEEAMLQAMLAEYDVDEATARKSISDFVSRMKELAFLE